MRGKGDYDMKWVITTLLCVMWFWRGMITTL